MFAKRRRSDGIKKTKEGYEKTDIYLVEGATSADEAVDAPGLPSIGEIHPESHLELECDSIEADSLPDDLSRYNVRVSYRTATDEGEDAAARRGNLAGGQESFSFDTGRETRRVKQARTSTPLDKSWARPGADVLDSKGVIGWDGEKAQGIDVPIGAFKFSWAKVYADGELPTGYLAGLEKNAHVVNSTQWGSWEPGEVLFTGASGRRTIGARIQVTGDDETQLGRFDQVNGVSSKSIPGGVMTVSLTRIRSLFRSPYRAEFWAGDRLIGLTVNAVPGRFNLISPQGENGISGSFFFFKYLSDNSSIQVTFPFPWSINFSFAFSKNVDSVEAGEIVTGPKKGWEYADIVLGPSEIEVGGVKYPTTTPQFAYFHEVFESVDFSFLGFDPEF